MRVNSVILLILGVSVLGFENLCVVKADGSATGVDDDNSVEQDTSISSTRVEGGSDKSKTVSDEEEGGSKSMSSSKKGSKKLSESIRESSQSNKSGSKSGKSGKSGKSASSSGSSSSSSVHSISNGMVTDYESGSSQFSSTFQTSRRNGGKKGLIALAIVATITLLAGLAIYKSGEPKDSFGTKAKKLLGLYSEDPKDQVVPVEDVGKSDDGSANKGELVVKEDKSDEENSENAKSDTEKPEKSKQVTPKKPSPKPATPKAITPKIATPKTPASKPTTPSGSRSKPETKTPSPAKTPTSPSPKPTKEKTPEPVKTPVEEKTPEPVKTPEPEEEEKKEEEKKEEKKEDDQKSEPTPSDEVQDLTQADELDEAIYKQEYADVPSEGERADDDEEDDTNKPIDFTEDKDENDTWANEDKEREVDAESKDTVELLEDRSIDIPEVNVKELKGLFETGKSELPAEESKPAEGDETEKKEGEDDKPTERKKPVLLPKPTYLNIDQFEDNKVVLPSPCPTSITSYQDLGARECYQGSRQFSGHELVKFLPAMMRLRGPKRVIHLETLAKIDAIVEQSKDVRDDISDQAQLLTDLRYLQINFNATNEAFNLRQEKCYVPVLEAYHNKLVETRQLINEKYQANVKKLRVLAKLTLGKTDQDEVEFMASQRLLVAEANSLMAMSRQSKLNHKPSDAAVELLGILRLNSDADALRAMELDDLATEILLNIPRRSLFQIERDLKVSQKLRNKISELAIWQESRKFAGKTYAMKSFRRSENVYRKINVVETLKVRKLELQAEGARLKKTKPKHLSAVDVVIFRRKAQSLARLQAKYEINDPEIKPLIDWTNKKLKYKGSGIISDAVKVANLASLLETFNPALYTHPYQEFTNRFADKLDQLLKINDENRNDDFKVDLMRVKTLFYNQHDICQEMTNREDPDREQFVLDALKA